LAYAVGAVSTAISSITGKEPMVPLESVKLAGHKMFIDSDKAARELGYDHGSVEDAFGRAIEWFHK